jgi:hypothetical protein
MSAPELKDVPTYLLLLEVERRADCAVLSIMAEDLAPCETFSEVSEAEKVDYPTGEAWTAARRAFNRASEFAHDELRSAMIEAWKQYERNRTA